MNKPPVAGPADAVRPPTDDEPSVLGAGGGLPPMPAEPTWNDKQLLDVVADYLARGNRRPLLDLGFENTTDIAVALHIVMAHIEQLESAARASVEAQEDRERFAVIEEVIGNGDLHNGDYLEVPSPYALSYWDGDVKHLAPFSTLRLAADFIIGRKRSGLHNDSPPEK